MLAGRGGELLDLDEAVSSGALVAVVGPPGIGKTTLVHAALRRRGPFRSCGALATLSWSPLYPLRRLIRSTEAHTPEDVVGAVLRNGTSPVLIEDLQWADEATLQALGLLVGRLALVVTVRTGSSTPEELLGVLDLLGARRIELGPLAVSDAWQLSEHLHPDLSDEERAVLVDAAEGNPLLLRELPLGDGGSPSLVSVLVERMARLGADGQRAIERLAVLGRPAGTDVVGPGSEEIVAAGLAVRDAGRLVARHALLGEVIADLLGPRADAVCRELAPLVPAAEAAHLLERAGDLTAARAAALRALAELDRGDRLARAELLELAVRTSGELDLDNRAAAARLFTETSQPNRALGLCQVPGRADLDPRARGTLRAVEGEALWSLGQMREAMVAGEEALSDLRGSRTVFEALVLAASTVAHTYIDIDGRPALERAQEAVRLADELGEAQGYVRTRLASVLMTSGEPGWQDAYAEALAIAAAEGDADVHRMAFVGLILGTWASGDVREAERLARLEMADEPRQGWDVPWLTVAAYAAMLGTICGRDRAGLVAEFRPILDREPFFRGRPFLDAAVTIATADLGRHIDAAALAEGIVRRAGDEPQMRSLAWWAVAEAALLAGRFEEAAAVGEEVLELGIGDYPSAVMARLVSAHGAGALGLPPPGSHPGAVLPAWSAAPFEWDALVAAADGDDEAASAAFERAADRWAGSDVRSEVRCRWAAGVACATTDRARSRILLERADLQAAGLGLEAQSSGIRRSLRAVGATRRVGAGSGIAGLTGREVQVLDLVAAGMRSTQVAAALAIEASTVESIVRSACRKLGVPTRIAAVARLIEFQAAPADPEGLSEGAGELGSSL